MFGREYYNDTYVIVKIPKKELDKKIFSSGPYLINEINKRIKSIINNNELSVNQVDYINKINNVSSKEELELLKKELLKDDNSINNIFNSGIDFKITTSKEYVGLSTEQELEKNKLILKLDIINKNIIPYFSNRRLIETVKLGFSTSEFIHYKDIEGEKVKLINKELVDVWSLIQQLPSDVSFLNELKKEMLYKTYKIKINGSFEYKDFDILESDLTIENMFNITNGQVNYKIALEMYKKSFYYAKSKLRALNSIELLKKIVDYNPKYNEIIEYLNKKAFGVEPNITTRFENNRIILSEAVSLDFKTSEQLLFNYLEHQSIQSLNEIINYPNETLKKIIPSLVYDEDITRINKEDYYANAIIDLFDWSKFNISKIYFEQRKEIINKLKENHIIELYNFLKQNNIKEEEIANALLTIVIKEKELKNIDLNDTFTLEQLEDFLGYYEIKDTEKLKLRSYQAKALKNIDKSFQTHKYTSVILPTGAGKSFVALAEMLENKDKKILYLAPNNEILFQLSRYTKNFITGSSGTSGLNNNQILKRKFKNITTATYSKLTEETAKDIIAEKYDLIIFDELHRTGAEEWNKYVKELINNQNKDVKVLGITATPQRDMDLSNMSDYWAKHFGYTEEEIAKQKHIATNMDLEEGIRSKYVVNPKLVTCEYNLLKDGKLENLQEKINNIPDEHQKQELQKEYENLRRNVGKSNGIEQILEEYLKKDGRYIVFLPVSKKDNNEYEGEDGNQIKKRKAERIIQSYQTQMRQYIYASNYLKENIKLLDEINIKLQNNEELSLEAIQYLHKEKKNILLLSKISNITENNNILVTHTNDIADNIINYMKWQPLSIGEQGKLLREKTKNLVECNSMLGSYSNEKNSRELGNFSSSKSNKIKFMFVMNKLNEGVHIEDIDGIIWLRAMEENSKILYLQQLGRCIFGSSPTKPILEEKRPLVIDLVNNTLTVKIDKDDIQEIKDLHLIRIIENYLDSNKKLDLTLDNDDIELYYARNLKRIKNKYIKYLNHSNLLNDLEYKKQRVIEEIIYIGSNLDLWSKDFIVNNNSKIKDKKDIETTFSLYDGFQLTGVIKDFQDLTQTTNELNLSYKDKIAEYIEKMNKGYKPRKKDSTETFSNGDKINIFWNQNKKKIIEELNTNPKYQTGYETAKKIISDKYLDKVSEYIEKLNKGYNPIALDQNEEFSNGDKINTFWRHNREKIIKELNTNPKYQTGYKTARKMISDKNIDKISEYIEKLNNGYLPQIKDSNEYFSNGDLVNYFWTSSNNKDKIINELNTNPKYQTGYETAKEMIKEKKINKVSEYIEKLNNGYKPIYNDTNETFSNNDKIKYFWKISKQKIIEELNTNPKYQTGYETAKEMIKDKDIDKVSEFIEKLNNGYIPLYNDSSEIFSNGDKVSIFWYRNKEKIIEELNSNLKYKTGYETAKEIIKEKNMKKINKLTEFIEKLNNGYIPKFKDPNEFFSNGESVNNFWRANNNKDKIITELNTNPKYQTGYETAKKIIEDKKLDKIAEYIEKLNNGYKPITKDSNETFSNGDKVNYFWTSYNNKEKIIEELTNNPKYKTGYEIAKQTINNIIEEIRKKENKKLIKELCLRYNIDTKVNKSILNKSYEEVYAKICYLEESKQDNAEQRDMSIIKNGKLHEIFFMSDLNMQINYGMSLDNLINKYINESTRGK